jgi:Acyl-coenzyme A synthetases/AMP-(fatty) acid ligases
MSGFIPSTVPEYFNVVDLHLDRWIREGLSSKTALIDLKSNESVTYSELYTLTCKLANLLTEYSIEMFDKVMIAVRDSKFSVTSFLAAMRAGAVPFFVNPNLTGEEFRFYIRDSICRAIISDDTTANTLKIAASDFGKQVKVLINVDDDEFSSLLRDLNDHFPLVKTHRDDPAYMVYTSGTTGRPKGAVHLHHDLVYAVTPYVTHIIDVRSNDLFIQHQSYIFQPVECSECIYH